MEANRDCISFCRSGEEIRAALEGGKTAAFLSVEGAELLDCSLERLEEAHAMGVRAVNLTWNHANALSGTNAEETDRGLSAQGRAFVREMERLGMLVDVSHLSDPGFWDVAEMARRPLYCQPFQCPSRIFPSQKLDRCAIYCHNRAQRRGRAESVCQLSGGEGGRGYGDCPSGALAGSGGQRQHVALGGDLDGCAVLPAGISGIQDLDRLWERLLQRNYSEALVRALFFENLMRVVSEVCTM